MNHQELYPTKKIKIIDLLPSAIMFNDCFSKHLVPPPLGIYVRNETKPRMLPQKNYRQYVITDDAAGGTNKVEVPLTYHDIEQIESAVYNEDGDMVISQRHVSLLSNEPTLPVVAIDLIYDLMQTRLAASQNWTGHNVKTGLLGAGVVNKGDYDVILRYLNQSTLNDLHHSLGDFENEEVMVDLFEEMLMMLRAVFGRLTAFVGEDHWCVHFMEFLNPTSLQINKSVDYRIASWHEQNNTPVDY